jgi:hypothetical protein
MKKSGGAGLRARHFAGYGALCAPGNHFAVDRKICFRFMDIKNRVVIFSPRKPEKGKYPWPAN